MKHPIADSEAHLRLAAKTADKYVRLQQRRDWPSDVDAAAKQRERTIRDLALSVRLGISPQAKANERLRALGALEALVKMASGEK